MLGKFLRMVPDSGGRTFIDSLEGFEQTGKCERMCLVHASSFADMNLDIFCVLALFKSSKNEVSGCLTITSDCD